MGAASPGGRFSEDAMTGWLGLDGGRWRAREDQASCLTPLISCLDRGDFPEGARWVRRTQKRRVYYCEAGQQETAGFFVKEYRSLGMVQAMRSLVGSEPARREWTNAVRLGHRGVLTYEVVSLGRRGRLWEQARSYLITREVSGGMTLMEALTNLADAGDGARERLLNALARFIACMHEAGVEHLDLHGGNLLVKWGDGRPRIYLADLQQVRVASRLSPRRRTRDLARLLHSLHECLAPRERDALILTYGGHTGFTPPAGVLGPRVKALRRRRLRSRTKRCLQEGSSFARLRTRSCQVHCCREFPLELVHPILREARGITGKDGPEVLKDSSETTITRHLAKAGGQTWKICVKRYHARSWLDRFIYVCRRSRARRSWLAGWGLWVRGVPTPPPWALVEDRSWWIPGEGAVIMEDLQGAEPLNRYAARFFAHGVGGDPRRRREFTGFVAGFFRELHAGEIFHEDVKATNLLVQQDGAGWRISLVDLDHVRFDKPIRQREQALNLAQLHASIPPCVGSTYRWRFLRACLQGRSREAIRSMAAEVVKISRARFQSSIL